MFTRNSEVYANSAVYSSIHEASGEPDGGVLNDPKINIPEVVNNRRGSSSIHEATMSVMIQVGGENEKGRKENARLIRIQFNTWGNYVEGNK
jgi:hypothetical protein